MSVYRHLSDAVARQSTRVHPNAEFCLSPSLDFSSRFPRISFGFSAFRAVLYLLLHSLHHPTPTRSLRARIRANTSDSSSGSPSSSERPRRAKYRPEGPETTRGSLCTLFPPSRRLLAHTHALARVVFGQQTYLLCFVWLVPPGERINAAVTDATASEADVLSKQDVP